MASPEPPPDARRGARSSGYEIGPVLALTALRRPALGGAWLVCVDGPAGSGKSTLARTLQHHAPGSVLLETDEMLQGWTGLPTLRDTLTGVFAPMAAGRTGRWRRWAWDLDTWAEWHDVPSTDLVILEGVGAGSPVLDAWRSTLVWVEAPPDLRLERGIRRDGEAMRGHWLRFRDDEDRLHALERTRDRADVLVDGVTGAISVRADR